ncbi:hypothetical protein UFOVP1384_16 [uncultured Caudovirales phage]|uniref:Uncharacterized protein n=1 Tax=uncultured Caudovirales phage TaxID=2100421 RepID=A0A6J5S626_9CAUD|nr:hypothetical protein UFOVP1384_16 [uncultured Caudovirales phage]
MSEKKQQIRLGSGKKINETFLSSSLCITDALEYVYEYNGKKYIKLNISIFAEPDQFGKNVKITLNDYDPKSKDIKAEIKAVSINTNDDLPF